MLACAVVISAVRGEATSASSTNAIAPLKAVSCPDDAVAIERRVDCGLVRLPLDRAKPSGQKINVYFELYPRRDRARPALSTVLSIEGGPGESHGPADRDARAEVWCLVSGRGLLP